MTKKNLILALCLSSCAGLPSLDYISAAKNSLAYISGKNNYPITRELYEQQEYSFIKVRIGRFEPLIMVLAYADNGVYEWVGADNSKIYTYKGKIIELNGFENDIKIQFPRSKIKNFLTNSNTTKIGFPKPRNPNYNTRFHDETIDILIKNNSNINLHDIVGKKGTIILVDTTYIHRGNIIKNGERNAMTQYFF